MVFGPCRIGRDAALGVLVALTSCAPAQNPVTSAQNQTESETQEVVRLLVGEETPPTTPVPTAQATAPRRVILPGTGQRIGGQAPSDPYGVEGTGDGLKLNFQDAPVRDIAAAVLGDALGLDYTVDERVKATLTLKTNRAIPQDALLSVLEASLDANGIALVQRSGLYIVTAKDDAAIRSAFPTTDLSSEGLTAGFGVQVVPLRHVSAQRLGEILRPFAPDDGGGITIDTDRNLIILSGTGPERAALLDMIAVFDVDWMAGLSYALFPLKTAEATTLVRELQTVFDTGDAGLGAGTIRFQPVERLNAILAIANDVRSLRRAESWINRLDTDGTEADERTLHVYRVQNGRARDLASVLGGIFGAREEALPGGFDNGLAPGLASARLTDGGAQNNAGPSSLAGGGAAGAQGLGGGGAGAGGLNSGLSGTPRQAVSAVQVSFATDQFRIIADERNNALLILATQRDYERLLASLRQLDVEPLQVLIEATIAEVTLTDELRFGLNWFFRTNSDRFALGFNDAANTVLSPTSTFGDVGFDFIFDGANGEVVLEALEEVTDVEVLSSPQLMVLNNQTALLRVGDEVPFPVRSAVSIVDDAAPIVNSIDFRETGVILRVTPRVNSNGMVQLDVEQEVSDAIATVSSGIDAPTVQQRRIESTVAVRSGKTIALGGLIQESRSETDTGLPVLGQLPLIGNLFKTTLRENDRAELLVLITPRVVSNETDVQSVTDELRKRMNTLEPLIHRSKLLDARPATEAE